MTSLDRDMPGALFVAEERGEGFHEGEDERKRKGVIGCDRVSVLLDLWVLRDWL